MKLAIVVLLGLCLSPCWTASPFLVYGPPAPGLLQPDTDFPPVQADNQKPPPDTDTPVGLTDLFEPLQPNIPETPVDIQRPLPESPVDIQNPQPESPVQKPLPETDTPINLTDFFEPQQPDIPETPVDIQKPLPETTVDIQGPLPETPNNIQSPLPDTDTPVGLTDFFEPQQPDISEAPIDVQKPLSDTNSPMGLTDFFEPQQPDIPEAPVNQKPVPLPDVPVNIQRPLPEAPVDIQNPVVLLDRPLLVLRDNVGQYSVGLQNEGPNGQTLTERGRLISTNGGWEYVIAKSGSYSYISPEGTPVSVQWEADHNGFRIVRSSV